MKNLNLINFHAIHKLVKKFVKIEKKYTFLSFFPKTEAGHVLKMFLNFWLSQLPIFINSVLIKTSTAGVHQMRPFCRHSFIIIIIVVVVIVVVGHLKFS